MDWRARWAGSRSRARTAGRWLAALALTMAVLLVGLPFAVRAFARAVELLLAACVSLALAISEGATAWTIGQSLAWSLAGAVVTPQGTGALGVLVAVAVGAFWGIQRLLGSEEE